MAEMVQLTLFFFILVIVVHASVMLVSAKFCDTNTSLCPKGVPIDYPLWIDDGSLGEGCTNYPGFGIKCASDGTPVMNITNNLYTLLTAEQYFSSTEQYPSSDWWLLTVREPFINGLECPQPQQNVSIGSPGRFLEWFDTVRTRIFYNCSSPPPNIEAHEIQCLQKYYNNSTKYSYAVLDDEIPKGFDWFRNCQKSVVTHIQGDPSPNIVLQLQQGILIELFPPVNCTDCEYSGGRCSSIETTGEISCDCPGGYTVIDRVCRSVMAEMVQLTLFFFILVIVVNASVMLVSAEFCYTNTRSCLIGVPITYPLWIDDGSLVEGCTNYPGFGIKCARDRTAVMNITNNLYTLLSAQQYGSDSWLLTVRDPLNGLECPQPQQNLSIGSPRFLGWDSPTRMRIFYNCSRPPPNIKPQEIQCLQNNNSTKHSYAVRDDEIPKGFDWFRNCQKSVVTYIQGDPSPNIVQQLQQGIGLYTFPPVNCTDCEYFGGRCSSNETTGAIICHCPGGNTRVDRVCPNDYEYGQHRKRVIIGVSAGAGSSVLILIVLLVVYRKRVRPCYNVIVSYWKKKTKNPTNVEVFLENYGCLALQRYKYSAVKKMTNSFKEPLGQGGYGSVFKGKLRDGRLVAVKVLIEDKGKGLDFINEVAAIGRTNHVNVVSLLGFCTEKNKRALVYEYMPNGSLERFIYREKNSSTASPLGPEKLYEITIGIARGLEYLHRGCNTRILHLDIKPHNILLDQDFFPKISDFGLAKLCPTKESLVSMIGTRGTPGYIAPEVYCRNFGGVSHKSDVYSYGMMVLEMIGGRKNVDATVENLSEIYFPHWVYTRLERQNAIERTGDTIIEVSGECFKDEAIKKMIIVALWCIQPHPGDRPSMNKVVDMLQENVNELQMPPNPFPDPSSISSATP